MYDGETDEVYGGQLFKCCNTEYSFSMFDLLTARAFAFTQQHQHYSCSEYRLLSSDLHVSEQQFDAKCLRQNVKIWISWSYFVDQREVPWATARTAHKYGWLSILRTTVHFCNCLRFLIYPTTASTLLV